MRRLAALALVVFAFSLTVAVTRATGAPAGPSASAREKARAHFKAGSALFEVGEHDKAIAEYQEAYRLAPLPDLFFNIAQAYRLKGTPADKQRAADYYRRYLKAKPAGVGAAEARERLAVLDKELAEPVAPPPEPIPAGAPPVANKEESPDGGAPTTPPATPPEATDPPGKVDVTPPEVPVAPVAPTTPPPELPKPVPLPSVADFVHFLGVEPGDESTKIRSRFGAAQRVLTDADGVSWRLQGGIVIGFRFEAPQRLVVESVTFDVKGDPALLDERTRVLLGMRRAEVITLLGRPAAADVDGFRYHTGEKERVVTLKVYFNEGNRVSHLTVWHARRPM